MAQRLNPEHKQTKVLVGRSYLLLRRKSKQFVNCLNRLQACLRQNQLCALLAWRFVLQE